MNCVFALVKIGKVTEKLGIQDTYVQRSLANSAEFRGTGLHTGCSVTMRILPAQADAGIVFVRRDLVGINNVIPALWSNVEDARLCTRLVNDAGATVSTVEHIMAAFAGCGVHNAIVELDGPEVPIMDGSARHFAARILNAGLIDQPAPLKAWRVMKDVLIEDGPSWLRLIPAKTFAMDYGIEFTDAAIGRQHLSLDLSNGSFVRELADSRTFCRQVDVDAMHDAGLARGGSLDNAVVVDGDRVLTPGGFRHADEAVRHKMLDAVGDLALAGAPILGRYQAFRAGHMLTNRLLRKVFATPGAVKSVTISPAEAHNLPGFGILATDLRAVA